MKNRQKRAAIITVGSESGEYPHGGFPLYAATKAFDNHFIKSLQYAKTDNIDMILFEPGPTNTPMLNKARPGIEKTFRGQMVISEPKESADQCFRKIGTYPIIYGTAKHGL